MEKIDKRAEPVFLNRITLVQVPNFDGRAGFKAAAVLMTLILDYLSSYPRNEPLEDHLDVRNIAKLR